MTLLAVLAVSVVVVAALMTATALTARRLGRVAVVSAVLGDTPVRWVLLGMVAVWGLRLAWHIGRRQVQHPHEDPRYEKMLGGGGFATAIRKVFVVQGLAMWFVSLPVQVGAVFDTHWWWVAGVGVALWLVGLVLESVGDAQLAAYKRDAERPPVMDRGLWGWTRHPNYFGDACVWWGIWLVGAAAAGPLPAVATVAAPLAMTYFLAFATGARLLERSMMQRPGYPEYAERTSMFFPLPPRKRAR